MKPDRDGFSLVEALVALAVTGTLAVATLGTLRATLDATGRADAAAQRAALLEYCLGRLKLAPATALARLPDSLRELHLPEPYTPATCWTTARPVRGVRDLYDLTVQVTWDGGAATLATRVYRPPQEEPHQ